MVDPGQGQDQVRGHGQGQRVPKVLVQGEFITNITFYNSLQMSILQNTQFSDHVLVAVLEPVPDPKADQKADRRVVPDQNQDLVQGVDHDLAQEHLQGQGQDHLPKGLRDPGPSLVRVQEAVRGQSRVLRHVRDHHDQGVVQSLVQGLGPVLQAIPTKFRCCPKLITMTYLLTITRIME